MTVSYQQEVFGNLHSGEAAYLFTLKNEHGMVACVTNYGATLTQLHVPDANGKAANVVLGFDSLEPYLGNHPYLGSTVGRYANRIAGASFDLDGKAYRLAKNNGENCLHGGLFGFDKRLWRIEEFGESRQNQSAFVRLSLLSPHMEEGFPGNLNVSVTYELTGDNELRIDYRAGTDRATPLNLTNHSYFNLKGAGNGDILDHELSVFSDAFTPVNECLIPTGEIASVQGTAMDFRKPRTLRSRIDEMKIGGYDHNFVLNKSGAASDNSPTLAAVVFEPSSRRRMVVLTTEPGIQIYTGNNLDGSVTGLGGAYEKHYAICLETQHYPDSVHHAGFPDAILRPGREYRQTTVFQFSN